MTSIVVVGISENLKNNKLLYEVHTWTIIVYLYTNITLVLFSLRSSYAILNTLSFYFGNIMYAIAIL